MVIQCYVFSNLSRQIKCEKRLNPRLSSGTREFHRLLNRLFGGTLFLNQLHDFPLLSLKSFLLPFFKSKFTKKILDTEKIHFRRPNASFFSVKLHKLFLSKFAKTKMKVGLFDSHINQVQHFDRVGNWCMSSLSDSNCNFRDAYVSQQKKTSRNRK